MVKKKKKKIFSIHVDKKIYIYYKVVDHYLDLCL